MLWYHSAKNIVKRPIRILRRYFTGMPQVPQLRMSLEKVDSQTRLVSKLPPGYSVAKTPSVSNKEWLHLLNQSGEFGELNLDDLQRVILDSLIPSTDVFLRWRGELVSCASVCALPAYHPFGVLMYVVVLPGHRGHGLGQFVTTQAVASANQARYHKILLHTDENRIAAIQLYRKMGFVPKYQSEADKERWDLILSKLGAA